MDRDLSASPAEPIRHTGGGAARDRAAEVIEYAAARLIPGPATTRMRRSLAKLQPPVASRTWAEQSQSRRMLRWLISGQARHATLQPVRAALLLKER